MGIRGLSSYVYEKKKEFSTDINLTEVALDSPNGITLLVDLHALVYFCLRNVDERRNAGVPFVNVLGGEFPAYAAEVEAFVTGLRKHRIHIICIADASRGTDDDKRKESEHKSRHLQKQENIRSAVQACRQFSKAVEDIEAQAISRGDEVAKVAKRVNVSAESDEVPPAPVAMPEVPASPEFRSEGALSQDLADVAEWRANAIRDVKRKAGTAFTSIPWFMPLMGKAQAVHTLRRLGVVVQVCHGEADAEIVRRMVDTDAFAILSNDSDFLAIKNSRYIPFTCLRRINKPSSSKGMLYSPESDDYEAYYANVFSPEQTANGLAIPLISLVDLCAVMGNDITAAEVERVNLHRKLGFKDLAGKKGSQHHRDIAPVDQVTRWLRKQKDCRAMNSHTIQHLMETDESFRVAFETSSDFYLHGPMTSHQVDPAGDDPMAQLLGNEMSRLMLPSSVLAIYRNKCWYGHSFLSIERDSSRGVLFPSPNILHRALRRIMYAFVGVPTVTEIVPCAVDDESEYHESTNVKAVDGFPTFLQTKEYDENNRRSVAHMMLQVHIQNPTKLSTDPLAAFHVKSFSTSPENGEVMMFGMAARYFVSLNSLIPKIEGRTTMAEFDAVLITFLMTYYTQDMLDHIDIPIGAAASPPSERGLAIISRYMSSQDASSQILMFLRCYDGLPPPSHMFSGTLFHAVSYSLRTKRPICELGKTKATRDMIISLLTPNLPKLRDAVLCCWTRQELSELFGADVHTHSTLIEVPANSLHPRYSQLRGSVTTTKKTPSQPPSGQKPMGEARETYQSPPRAPLVQNQAHVSNDTLKSLPIYEHKGEIVSQVRSHVVSFVQGETGCGKSCMVPQFIYQDAVSRGEKVNIVVTLPRRIAAVTLAKRVASQLGSPLGGLVGYCIGMESYRSTETRITYVTVGWLLQRLAHNPQDLANFTHIVLDEAHERSMDADMLSLLLRIYFTKDFDKTRQSHRAHTVVTKKRDPKPQTKIVIMSATLEGSVFLPYFSKMIPPTTTNQESICVMQVGSRRFHNSILYLDDISSMNLYGACGSVDKLMHSFNVMMAARTVDSDGDVGKDGGEDSDALTEDIGIKMERISLSTSAKDAKSKKSMKSSKGSKGKIRTDRETPTKEKTPSKPGKGTTSDDLNCMALDKDITKDFYKVIIALIAHTVRQGASVLVFLPGLMEITEVSEQIEAASVAGRFRCPVEAIVMHSLAPEESHDAAFAKAGEDSCARVILATNIAESSVTIPDTSVVIDSGLHREIHLDKDRNVPILLTTYISRSSADQRAGRTGRTGPGVVYRVFPRAFYADHMSEHGSSEMMRLSLANVVLKTKVLLSPFGTVEKLLSQAVDPPPLHQLDEAFRSLASVGALTSPDDDGGVTRLGHLACSLPIDVRFTKLLLMGLASGRIAFAVILAGILSVQEVFSMHAKVWSKNFLDFVNKHMVAAEARELYDDGYASEPIACMRLYMDWIGDKRVFQRLSHDAVSFQRLRQLDQTIAELSQRVVNFVKGQPDSYLGVTETRTVIDTLESLSDAAKSVRGLQCGLSRMSNVFINKANEKERIRENDKETERAKDVKLRSLPSWYVAGGASKREVLDLKVILVAALAPTFVRVNVRKSALATVMESRGFKLERSMAFAPTNKSVLDCDNHVSEILHRNAELGRVECVSNKKAVLVQCLRLDDPEEYSASSEPDADFGEAPKELYTGRVIQDLPMDLRLLRKLEVTGTKTVVPIDRNAPDGSDKSIVLGRPVGPTQLSWFLETTKGRQLAIPNRRSVLSNACVASGKAEQFFGVAANALSVRDNLVMGGITLLPDAPAFSALMNLVFAASTPPVVSHSAASDDSNSSSESDDSESTSESMLLKAFVDSTGTRIQTFSLAENVISFAPSYISVSDLQAVNAARQYFSAVATDSKLTIHTLRIGYNRVMHGLYDVYKNVTERAEALYEARKRSYISKDHGEDATIDYGWKGVSLHIKMDAGIVNSYISSIVPSWLPSAAVLPSPLQNEVEVEASVPRPSPSAKARVVKSNKAAKKSSQKTSASPKAVLPQFVPIDQQPSNANAEWRKTLLDLGRTGRPPSTEAVASVIDQLTSAVAGISVTAKSEKSSKGSASHTADGRHREVSPSSISQTEHPLKNRAPVGKTDSGRDSNSPSMVRTNIQKSSTGEQTAVVRTRAGHHMIVSSKPKKQVNALVDYPSSSDEA